MAHKLFHHLHVELHIIFAIFKYIFDILATNIHSNNFGLQKLPKDRFKRFCVREFILGRDVRSSENLEGGGRTLPSDFQEGMQWKSICS